MKMNEPKKTVTLTIGGKEYSYPKDTSLSVIARDFQKDEPHDIVLAMINGKLHELHHAAREDAEIRFVTTADEIGHKTYKRSCSMLFLSAVYHIGGYEKIRRVVLHFSVSSGFFYTIEGDVEIDGTFIKKVEDHMHEIVEKKIPIIKRTVSTNEAIDLFKRHHMPDKEQLFRTRLASRVNIYKLGEFEDYYYGFMTNHTGYLKYFKLYPYQGGIVLQMPEADRPEEVPPFAEEDKLFSVQILGESWAQKMGIDTIGELNSNVIAGKTRQTILIAEALMETRISSIADQIQNRKKVKFVMIAGPSSSGKTTFSQRLMIQLFARGLKPHYVGVDNYFKDRTDTPVGEDGRKDFESLAAIDVKGFNEDMTKLLSGEKVEMPVYDFVEGRRTYKGDIIKLEENDLLVIEGIHCLNDKLSYSLPKESEFRIYISALTQLNIDEHNRIPSTDGRLIRRIVRDYRTRGYSARETLSMWNSVRQGEIEHIFPFQEKSDVIFNSALLYELSVLKLYAQPLLFQVEEDDPQYYEAKRLLKFLDYFIGVPADDVPHNSILREFIGGGCFRL